MDAHPKKHSSPTVTERQATGPADDASGKTRAYDCLDCGRQFESFTRECPGCGGRQFQTTVPGTAESEPTNLDQIESVLARFNPYIPR